MRDQVREEAFGGKEATKLYSLRNGGMSAPHLRAEGADGLLEKGGELRGSKSLKTNQSE